MASMTDAARRSPARRIVLAVIAAIVVIAAGLFAWERFHPVAGPSELAGDYFTLLAQGRAQDALALTDFGTAPNGLLLTDKLYAKADRGISGVKPGAARVHGDQASVTVSYRQHGKAERARVTLGRVDNGPFQPASWRITGPHPATVDATIDGADAKSLSVDGVALPLPSGGGTVAIPALPGRYTLELGSSSPLFSGVPAKVDVTASDAPVAVTLGLAPTDQLATTATKQAQDMLNGCFGQPTLTAGCPLAQGIRNLFNLTAEETVTYRLTAAPTLAFDPKTMRVASTADGQVVATPTDAKWGTFDNSAEFSLAFDVSVDGESVQLSPADGGVSLVKYVE